MNGGRLEGRRELQLGGPEPSGLVLLVPVADQVRYRATLTKNQSRFSRNSKLCWFQLQNSL